MYQTNRCLAVRAVRPRPQQMPAGLQRLRANMQAQTQTSRLLMHKAHLERSKATVQAQQANRAQVRRQVKQGRATTDRQAQ